jgi:hypothetical protein
LQDGKWLACSLLSGQNGQKLLDGEQAVNWLSQKGSLEWQLFPSQQFSELQSHDNASLQERLIDSPAPAGKKARLIPRRLTPDLGQKHPRDVRHIFLLIDGRRSLEDMARLLHKPYDDVVRIARMLVAEGVVTIHHD